MSRLIPLVGPADMSISNAPDTDELIQQARGGNQSAVDGLLARHRDRLKYMVAVRMDRRLASRIDPSDVVQETLIEAARRMDAYLRWRPMPFYPWLRGLAWNRLLDLHRRHIKAERRTVEREVRDVALSDQSAALLAGQLVSRDTGVVNRLVREELRLRVQQALMRLTDDHREILLMRHLERMSVAEIAAVTGVTEGTVKSRAFRALRKLKTWLSDEGSGERHD